jgi:hypothetical protein
MALIESKTAIVAIVLLSVFGGATVAMAASGYGPLAYISYSVTGTSNEQVVAAHINLGNLNPGASGTVTANATVKVDKSGNYTFKLEEVEKLSKVFSSFNVTINIANHILNLSLNDKRATLYLQNGTYTVLVTIHYVVSNHPKSEHVENEPLIVFHPAGEDNDTED